MRNIGRNVGRDVSRSNCWELLRCRCRRFLTVVAETWLPHSKYHIIYSTGGRHLHHATAGQAEAWRVEEVLLQSLVQMAKEAFAGGPEAAACMFGCYA